jgi:hypothetical protein
MFVRILALLFGALGLFSLFHFDPGANKGVEWLVGLVSAFFVLYGLLGERPLTKVAPRLVDRGEAREAMLAALESLPATPFYQLLLINMTRIARNPLLIIPILLASIAVATYCQSLLSVPQSSAEQYHLSVVGASYIILLVIFAFLKTLIQRRRRDQAKDVTARKSD